MIDQALKENRLGEWLCYAFATVFVLVGAAVILRGLFWADQSVWVTIPGSCVSALFIPALNSARRIRKENLAIRLLEAPLAKSETAEAAADMLQKCFLRVFVDTKE